MYILGNQFKLTLGLEKYLFVKLNTIVNAWFSKKYISAESNFIIWCKTVSI